ncbi:MAG: hypothetical protein KC656_15005, partial [Myxococcales bacterium]|nr:hypothetical protein [Myxococcales bacterium]
MSTEKHLARLFQSNPPNDPDDIRGLFCNRERELAFGVALLQDQSLDRIGAIHGETRCGKSHLARRLLVEVDELGLPFLPIQVNANDLGTARGALESVFYALLGALGEVPRGQVEAIDSDSLGHAAVFDQVLERLHAIEPLVEGIQIRRTEEHSQKLSRTASVSIDLGSSGNLGSSMERVSRQVFEQGVLTERQLAEVFLREASDLLHLVTCKRVLLYVDDLDLLAQGDESDGTQVRRLIELLKVLATTDSVTVLASVRTQFFAAGEGKHFRDFIRVPPLEDSIVREVYVRHVQRFHANEEIFDETALTWLIDSTTDRVGVFLQLCFDVWRFGFGRPLPLGEDTVRAFASARVKEWRQNVALAPIIRE